MSHRKRIRPATGPLSEDDAGKELWLLGQPPLADYLAHVQDMVCGGDSIPKSRLVREWRAANDRYGELEQSEAGFADNVTTLPVAEELRPRVRAMRRDSRFRRAFDTVPTRLAMVELDRLIVGQPHIDLLHVERLRSQLPPSPSPSELLDFCLPPDEPQATVSIRKTGYHKYTFSSESSDFRFHEPVMLRPEQVRRYDPIGPLGGILGLAIGYGSNFLSLIEYDSRLVIHNGHHRAYAARSLGLTHAPCIIQKATRIDELEILASRHVVDDPAFYFRSQRPPLLKDFFDPELTTVLPTRRTRRMVELSFEVRSYEVAV